MVSQNWDTILGDCMNNKKQKHKKLRTKVILIFVLLTAVVIGIVAAVSLKTSVRENHKNSVVEKAAPSETPVAVTDYQAMSDDEVNQLYTEYQQDHAVNDDVKGILCFNSGLVHQPVVQGETNDTYLRTNWQDMSYSSSGSVFLDYINDLNKDEENTIIYGHYVYENVSADRTIAFTPLRQLRDQTNYEANKELVLVTDKDVRYYRMTDIFDCPLEEEEDGTMVTVDDLQYNLPEYDDDYFKTYINAVRKADLYDTGQPELTKSDHILTLQTCIQDDTGNRQIMLCREVMRKSIKDGKVSEDD